MLGTPAQPALQPIQPQDPEARSLDLVAENVAKLRALFPELVTEGPAGASINVDVLKQLVGDRTLTDADEKYGLTWHGKRRARQLALTPSTGTLRPCPEESVDWETTQNLMIEGDNLEVLKLLQKSYAGKVSAIYIDPPYNTGRNLIYPNDYSDGIRTYLEVTEQADGNARMTSNPEAGGRFHTNWLSMIYPRLLAARTLLREDGVMFCAIDENEQANLALVLKEVFPEGSYEHAYVSIVHNPRGQQGKNISYVHETGIFVYPSTGKKYLADLPRDEVDSRNLRDSGTESDRTDARTCFYPILCKGNEIVGIGEVPRNDFHPASANVERPDGITEIWPLTDNGDEKKWRYSNESVKNILGSLEVRHGRTTRQVIFNKTTSVMRSVWQAPRYDSSEYGTKLVYDLVGDAGFAYPKSLWAVCDSIRVMIEGSPGAIVLDFFAGTGTTGHAVWDLNRTQGGQSQFILVQLPEPLSPEAKEQRVAAEFCDKLGKPRTIAELTKERLRRAGAKLREEHPMFQGDLGFRVFKLDTSNLRAWDPTPADVEGALIEAVEHVKPDRSEADVLYEVLLKLGLDLCVPIERRAIAGLDVHAVGGGVLFACLAKRIERDQVEPLGQGIAAWRDELAPAGEVTCVLRDAAFADDVAKTNLAAILLQRGVTAVRSL